MITYAGKFFDIAEYNDTFVVHLRLSCKKSHKKCFFLIYITIVRIDENKAYRHGGLYTSGRGQLIIFFYHSNTNTNRVSDNQSYLWKKVFKYTKTLFFNCVLQNTAGHKGLKWALNLPISFTCVSQIDRFNKLIPYDSGDSWIGC